MLGHAVGQPGSAVVSSRHSSDGWDPCGMRGHAIRHRISQPACRGHLRTFRYVVHQAAGSAVAHNLFCLRSTLLAPQSASLRRPLGVMLCTARQLAAQGATVYSRHISVSLQGHTSRDAPQQVLAQPTLAGNGPTA